MSHLCEDERISPTEALDEVTRAMNVALAHGRRLSKDELHEELRHHVRDELLPWCEGCRSHHVPPMLWRYATIAGGVRLDKERRYLLGSPSDPPPAHEAVHRYLRWYGPGTPGEFSEWAGVSPSHGRRLWDEIEDELVEIEDHLQYARRFYNGAVRDLNTKIETFPALLVARTLAFKPAEFFRSGADQEAPA